jgi:DNA-binding CsgD family transcriptional regulator
VEPHLVGSFAPTLADLLGGPPSRATSGLLLTATRGDPALLRMLIAAGLAVGALSLQVGQWHWGATAHLARLVESCVLPEDQDQLDAWETLTQPLGEPYRVVTRIRRGGPRPADLGITPREFDVLLLLCAGLTADAMARRLDVSARTVTKHQERLYRKLGTTDRLTTVLRAQRMGIVTAPEA